jgi:hypothetical protein
MDSRINTMLLLVLIATIGTIAGTSHCKRNQTKKKSIIDEADSESSSIGHVALKLLRHISPIFVRSELISESFISDDWCELVFPVSMTGYISPAMGAW